MFSVGDGQATMEIVGARSDLPPSAMRRKTRKQASGRTAGALYTIMMTNESNDFNRQRCIQCFAESGPESIDADEANLAKKKRLMQRRHAAS